MCPLWGPSRRDQVHLLSALESLGSTSVAGLSAALSWPPRKTERCLRDVVASGAAPLRFDPARQSIEWVTASPTLPPPVPEVTREVSATRPRVLGLALDGPDNRPLTVSRPAKTGSDETSFASSRCPACHSGLVSTGDGTHGYCTKCGRLVTLAKAVQSIPGLDVGTHRAAVAPTPQADPADRKAQELFASWVSQRPIPCPRCRSTMNHHGVASYSCPACGEKVEFPKPVISAPAAAPAPPPSSSAKTALP